MNSPFVFVRQLSACILLSASLNIYAEKTTVAVASNFTAAMKSLVVEFEKQSGHEVEVAYGSSGRLYAQIKNGAPFHAFFSADQKKPEQLEADKLSVSDSRFTYAEGALALWTNKAALQDKPLDMLKENAFNKLAIANPRLAPYGFAAVEVLQHLDLYENTKAKWVEGENIAQTYQFVSTGNADLGFVALSQVISQQKNKVDQQQNTTWTVPQNLHTPIKQDALLLIKGKDNSAARALLDFIRSDQGKEIIQSMGYK